MERFDKLTRSVAESPAPVALAVTDPACRTLAQLDANAPHFSRDVMRLALQRPTWLTPESAVR
jgi:hypothetical protein